MDIFLAILSNFNPQACLIPISPIGLQQRRSNDTATKPLSSRARDDVFVKWNRILHRPPNHEVIHFISQHLRVTVYRFTKKHGFLWTAMAPRTYIYHIRVSHLLLPIDGAQQGESVFTKPQHLVFYLTHSRWFTCVCHVNEWTTSFMLKFKFI